MLDGLGATYPAALPPSAPNRSTVTELTPAGTVKVSVPGAVQAHPAPLSVVAVPVVPQTGSAAAAVATGG
ncbi:hypothetical protein OG429_32355 [Streptomyces sp. NBC_00190]|uniref:hypothetical protein n=1 Tax=Streptomyces sp. NBC_00190 TaxID=2903634 RepID=UPI002E2CCFD4|nr:hypothetical protein [Streptomyces sp. NBC_00190]